MRKVGKWEKWERLDSGGRKGEGVGDGERSRWKEKIVGGGAEGKKGKFLGELRREKESAVMCA